MAINRRESEKRGGKRGTARAPLRGRGGGCGSKGTTALLRERDRTREEGECLPELEGVEYLPYEGGVLAPRSGLGLQKARKGGIT